jgi:hypothetical protein
MQLKIKYRHSTRNLSAFVSIGHDPTQHELKINGILAQSLAPQMMLYTAKKSPAGAVKMNGSDAMSPQWLLSSLS